MDHPQRCHDSACGIQDSLIRAVEALLPSAAIALSRYHRPDKDYDRAADRRLYRLARALLPFAEEQRQWLVDYLRADREGEAVATCTTIERESPHVEQKFQHAKYPLVFANPIAAATADIIEVNPCYREPAAVVAMHDDDDCPLEFRGTIFWSIYARAKAGKDAICIGNYRNRAGAAEALKRLFGVNLGNA